MQEPVCPPRVNGGGERDEGKDAGSSGQEERGRKAQPGKSDYLGHCVLARLNNLIAYI